MNDLPLEELLKERVLDDIPPEYRPTTLTVDINCGVRGSIAQGYQSNLSDESVGIIYVEGKEFRTSPEVVAMLKAILYAGCCYIEERAKACREVFEKTLFSKTKEEFLGKLEDNPNNPFVAEVNKAVKEVWQA